MWIPDAEDVWKSAEILTDFKPGETVLELQLEDGTVGQKQALHLNYELLFIEYGIILIHLKYLFMQNTLHYKGFYSPFNVQESFVPFGSLEIEFFFNFYLKM